MRWAATCWGQFKLPSQWMFTSSVFTLWAQLYHSVQLNGFIMLEVGLSCVRKLFDVQKLSCCIGSHDRRLCLPVQRFSEDVLKCRAKNLLPLQKAKNKFSRVWPNELRRNRQTVFTFISHNVWFDASRCQFASLNSTKLCAVKWYEVRMRSQVSLQLHLQTIGWCLAMPRIKVLLLSSATYHA